jgi:hypothetical protein
VSITERYVTTTGAGAHDGTSEADAWSPTEALTNAVAGQRVNVKAGTYTLAANFTPANAGTVAQPIIWRGYNVTIGDLDTGLRSAASLALDVTNFPVIACGASWIIALTTSYHILQNLSVTGSKNDGLITLGSRNMLVRVKAVTTGSASSTAACTMSGTNPGVSIDCEFESTHASSVAAVFCNTAGQKLIGCRLKSASSGASSGGLYMNAGTIMAVRCVIVASAADAVFIGTTTGSCLVDSCTLYAPSRNCIGVANVAAVDLPVLVNCVGTDSTRFANNANSGTSHRPIVRYGCRTRDNGNADVGFDDWPSFGMVTTDTGGPTSDFGDLAGGTDYRLAAASPCLSAGHVGALDIGALQKTPAAGGSVGIIG